MKKIFLIFLIIGLIGFSSAQLGIFGGRSNSKVINLQSANASSTGSTGANVSSVTSSTNCITVNPTTGNVTLTFNSSCAGSGSSSGLSGVGTENYIPLWFNGTHLIDSLIYQNGSYIGINTTVPMRQFTISGINTTYTPDLKAVLALRSPNANVVVNNTLGEIIFVANDQNLVGGVTDERHIGASIKSIANGVWSDVNGSHDAGLVFSVKTDSTVGLNPAMVITHTGLVGIGTESPTRFLEIVGPNAQQFRITSNKTDGANKNAYIQSMHYNTSVPDPLILLQSNTNGANTLFVGGGSTALTSATDIIFYTGLNNTHVTGRETARIRGTTGFMSIGGIGNPLEMLHLNNTNNADIVQQEMTNSPIHHSFWMPSFNSTFGLFSDGSFRWANSATTLTNNVLMTLLSSGELGLGTTSPGAKLEINGTNSDFLQEWAVNNGERYIKFQAPNATPSDSFKFDVNSPLDFTINKSATALMTLAQTGRVGIGTTSPLGKLQITDINATGLSTGLYLKNTGSTNDSGISIDFDVTSTNNVQARISAFRTKAESDFSSALAFFVNTGGGSLTERMRIDTNGKVGIGTNSPTHLLNVAGEGNFTGNVTMPHQTYNISMALDTTYTNNHQRPIMLSVTIESSVTTQGDVAYGTLYTNGTRHYQREGISLFSGADQGNPSTEYHSMTIGIQPQETFSLNTTLVGSGSITLDRAEVIVI